MVPNSGIVWTLKKYVLKGLWDIAAGNSWAPLSRVRSDLGDPARSPKETYRRPNLKEKETFRRPSRLRKVTLFDETFQFLSFSTKNQ